MKPDQTKPMCDHCGLRNANRRLRGLCQACHGCKEIRSQRQRRNLTHGLTKTRIYKIWIGMWTRCTNQNEKHFARYGGRGILVCDQWKSFEKFLSDMGLPPSEQHSLDRIDNEKGYEPSNCRWASAVEQQRNRRDNRRITFNGETLCLAEWADRLGINHSTLIERLQKWPLERAITEPSRFSKRAHRELSTDESQKPFLKPKG